MSAFWSIINSARGGLDCGQEVLKHFPAGPSSPVGFHSPCSPAVVVNVLLDHLIEME
jgi:hypothetical protein